MPGLPNPIPPYLLPSHLVPSHPSLPQTSLSPLSLSCLSDVSPLHPATSSPAPHPTSPGKPPLEGYLSPFSASPSPRATGRGGPRSHVALGSSPMPPSAPNQPIAAQSQGAGSLLPPPPESLVQRSLPVPRHFYPTCDKKQLLPEHLPFIAFNANCS